MGEIKIGRKLIIIGFVIWIIENMYFGWNMSPMSESERNIDFLCDLLMKIGMFIYLLPIFSLYEQAVKNNEDNKTK